MTFPCWWWWRPFWDLIVKFLRTIPPWKSHFRSFSPVTVLAVQACIGASSLSRPPGWGSYGCGRARGWSLSHSRRYRRLLSFQRLGLNIVSLSQAFLWIWKRRSLIAPFSNFTDLVCWLPSASMRSSSTDSSQVNSRWTHGWTSYGACRVGNPSYLDFLCSRSWCVDSYSLDCSGCRS